ncbi:MAG TPA: membrane protein insertion efficiency factor YidD [Alphaproteobacteria bacterium]|jgi:putative membrane protein insertion efficiency factor|nr:membrane protein insertion efficiency factor YidD [Alphaproteobacteria bacterium]
MRAFASSLPALFLRALVRFYQLAISPLLTPSCRFEPSCSEYARQALTRFGAIEGARLTVLRLLRCHPWGGAGFDPVPASPAAHHHDHAPGCRHG